MRAHEVLGVMPNATATNYLSEYRRLALLHHPDKNGNSEIATKRFQMVNAALNCMRQGLPYEDVGEWPRPAPAPVRPATPPAVQATFVRRPEPPRARRTRRGAPSRCRICGVETPDSGICEKCLNDVLF